ncbi:uncharacterized protein [Asterias amurensis]|uniref:uncharacterized protein n=1 Tax=Asterias amurensis TaxID=7602 RepID=UPI003AB52A72
MATRPTTLFDSSPFHHVPCSPFVGTTLSSGSPAQRAVPDIGEMNPSFVADSPQSVAGQDVPQTPTSAHIRRPSRMSLRTQFTPCSASHRPPATPEQEVPQTPIKRDVSAKKTSHLKVKLQQENNRTKLVSRKEESMEINLFHGDDIFG